jgi:tyrosyl-tRNA synthetase
VSIDGEKVSDVAQSADITEYRLFKVGKRKFLKIKAE